MLHLSAELYPAPKDFAAFSRCTWCDFALVRATPDFRRIPCTVNLDVPPCFLPSSSLSCGY